MTRIRWLLGMASIVAVTLHTPAHGQIGDRNETTASDARVRRALQQTDLNFYVDKDGFFRLHFTFEDKRTHLVFIRSNTTEWGNMEIREVCAVGYKGKTPLSQTMLEKLLRDNATRKSGAWELQQESDGTYIALFVVKVSANCDADALETVIRGVAASADQMENWLTGTDEW